MRRLQPRTPSTTEPRANPLADLFKASDGRALPLPTVKPRILAGSDELQSVLGHSATCIALSRKGVLSSCDCTVRPLEDPAVVISIVVQFVRMSGNGKRPLPPLVTEFLTRQIEAGDPACRVIANWLVGMDLIDEKILRRRTTP
jgi:hypothetical protein